MKNKSLLIIGLIIFVLLMIRLSVFTVSANETAITTLFGRTLYEINAEPDGNNSSMQETSGVFFKWPFFQTIKRYDRRIHLREVTRKDRLTADEKNINVSLSLGWKIVSPKKFYETCDNYLDFENKLEQIIDGTLGQEIGKLSFDKLFGTEKDAGVSLLEKALISNNSIATKEAARYGVKVVFIKITHIGFPPSVLPTILERMKAERTKESALYIAQGSNEAKIILSQAEAEKDKRLAEARSEAKIARSEAQKNLAEYYKILSEAPELSSYLRKLDALKKILEGKGEKRLILDPENFLKEFEKNLEAN